MLRRILIITLLILGSISFSRGQSAHLRIMSLINFPDTAYQGVTYPIGMVLKNVGAAPFVGTFQILIEGDSAYDILYFNNSANYVLQPNDSDVIQSNPGGTLGYTFPANVFKAGNDIVVVWPYTIQSNVIIDSLYTAMYFVPVAHVSDYVYEQVSIYPNPFSDIITINPGSTETIEQVRIWDGAGRLAGTESSPGNSLNLSALQPGFYFVEVKTNARVFFEKIVKD